MKTDPLLITTVCKCSNSNENEFCLSFQIEGMDEDQDKMLVKYIKDHTSSSNHASVTVKQLEVIPLPIRTSFARKICVCHTMIGHHEADRVGKESAEKTAVTLREHLEKMLA